MGCKTRRVGVALVAVAGVAVTVGGWVAAPPVEPDVPSAPAPVHLVLLPGSDIPLSLPVPGELCPCGDSVTPYVVPSVGGPGEVPCLPSEPGPTVSAPPSGPASPSAAVTPAADSSPSPTSSSSPSAAAPASATVAPAPAGLGVSPSPLSPTPGDTPNGELAETGAGHAYLTGAIAVVLVLAGAALWLLRKRSD